MAMDTKKILGGLGIVVGGLVAFGILAGSPMFVGASVVLIGLAVVQ